MPCPTCGKADCYALHINLPKSKVKVTRDPVTGNMNIKTTFTVPYCGNQDDGQDIADDTDDDGGYGDDEDTTGGSPTGEREP